MKKDKLRKAAKGTRVAANVILVLCGIALVGFFGWLGYELYIYFGGAL